MSAEGALNEALSSRVAADSGANRLLSATIFKILRPNKILNVDSFSCVLLEQSLLNCSAPNLMFSLLTLKA